MPALMSLNANKIYLDYHLGNEIQCICRVNENKHLIRVILTCDQASFFFRGRLNWKQTTNCTKKIRKGENGKVEEK